MDGFFIPLGICLAAGGGATDANLRRHNVACLRPDDEFVEEHL